MASMHARRQGSAAHLVQTSLGSSPPTSSPLQPHPRHAHIVIGANSNSLCACLMHAIGAPHLLGPKYTTNRQRIARQAEIEGDRSVDARENQIPVGALSWTCGFRDVAWTARMPRWGAHTDEVLTGDLGKRRPLPAPRSPARSRTPLAIAAPRRRHHAVRHSRPSCAALASLHALTRLELTHTGAPLLCKLLDALARTPALAPLRALAPRAEPHRRAAPVRTRVPPLCKLLDALARTPALARSPRCVPSCLELTRTGAPPLCELLDALAADARTGALTPKLSRTSAPPLCKLLNVLAADARTGALTPLRALARLELTCTGAPPLCELLDALAVDADCLRFFRRSLHRTWT
ncbi:hypothetical protein GGX14DRAFT_577892 [Mycena pura]|uniref:Uncharacterized protein n=1 Tax=Mycena pura TaxID=153505 RepID=A0AAD6Y3K3_9AGAR|nr:hypothetical protein GGX14DRAFT_577892 [Mycena pura]